MVSLSDSLSFPGQQSRQLRLSGEILQLTGFPGSLVLPFFDFPIHKVNQESCNYGASERAESCAELSSSQQVGSVFSPQKTVSLPLLSRPIILAVYERISLPLCLSFLPPQHAHNTAWNLLLSLFWHQVGLFVYFGIVLHFSCCASLQ